MVGRDFYFGLGKEWDRDWGPITDSTFQSNGEECSSYGLSAEQHRDLFSLLLGRQESNYALPGVARNVVIRRRLRLGRFVNPEIARRCTSTYFLDHGKMPQRSRDNDGCVLRDSCPGVTSSTKTNVLVPRVVTDWELVATNNSALTKVRRGLRKKTCRISYRTYPDPAFEYSWMRTKNDQKLAPKRAGACSDNSGVFASKSKGGPLRGLLRVD